MKKFRLPLLLMCCMLGLLANVPPGALQVRPLIHSHLDQVCIEMRSLSNRQSLKVNIEVPEPADLWVAIYDEGGHLLKKDRFHGTRIDHLLPFYAYAEKAFMVHVSYAYGGILYAAKVKKVAG